ncbi:MAG: hypothetical protein J0M03_02460 [Acidobacteria bacterium]|nr:hypothetical protein [Acidobacteriota bacterium]
MPSKADKADKADKTEKTTENKGERGVKDVFKQVYDMWEKSAGEQIEKFARSQVFLTALAQNLEQTLNLSGRIKEISQTTMGVMNVASRQDVEAINKNLRAIRNALDEINEKLDLLIPKSPEPEPEPEPEPKPKTTRSRKKTT